MSRMGFTPDDFTRNLRSYRSAKDSSEAATIVVGCLLIVAWIAAIPLIVMLCWNYLALAFGFVVINYWHAWAVFILSRLLFSTSVTNNNKG